MLTTLSRSVIRSPLSRSFRTSAPSCSAAHGGYHHLPFSWPHTPSSRKIFGASIVAFLGLGFAVPFLAARYQLNKTLASTSE
ncbi:hypothetical protein E1B28_004447 [Marasmius oreades]|uniref:Cytochrome c oxidase subunit 8, mitochondrial n=1 Tax=Marasmius oreades TaxID=181124 RepID=A0A9P7UYK6_9AGAR|nr:uncharacterized protein E1B28_004447 [Marasmius oreades]KAG7097059.1 hypothetical protein E1B28_004447 [Marasmius oreades]